MPWQGPGAQGHVDNLLLCFWLGDWFSLARWSLGGLDVLCVWVLAVHVSAL